MKSYAIIGMSSFGGFLARNLAEAGIEILAIDLDEEKIEKIKPFVHKAVIADATDRHALESIGLKDVDGVIVSLGHIEASVLTTLHLKEMNIKKIYSKALSEDHGKILDQVGATDVIFPEKDMATRVARLLTHDNVLDHVPLSEGYSIVEIAPPSSFIGKSIAELNLRNRYGIQVIVVKELIPENVVLVPRAEHIIKDSDVMVLLGKDSDLSKIKNLT